MPLLARVAAAPRRRRPVQRRAQLADAVQGRETRPPRRAGPWWAPFRRARARSARVEAATASESPRPLGRPPAPRYHVSGPPTSPCPHHWVGPPRAGRRPVPAVPPDPANLSPPLLTHSLLSSPALCTLSSEWRGQRGQQVTCAFPARGRQCLGCPPDGSMARTRRGQRLMARTALRGRQQRARRAGVAC